jgi:ABC-type multidrug transport system ATPase subunit
LEYEAGGLKAKQVTGIVLEMANAYADLSGWDNLMLMAELYGIPASIAPERTAW